LTMAAIDGFRRERGVLCEVRKVEQREVQVFVHHEPARVDPGAHVCAQVRRWTIQLANATLTADGRGREHVRAGTCVEWRRYAGVERRGCEPSSRLSVWAQRTHFSVSRYCFQPGALARSSDSVTDRKGNGCRDLCGPLVGPWSPITIVTCTWCGRGTVHVRDSDVCNHASPPRVLFKNSLRVLTHATFEVVRSPKLDGLDQRWCLVRIHAAPRGSQSAVTVGSLGTASMQVRMCRHVPCFSDAPCVSGG